MESHKVYFFISFYSFLPLFADYSPKELYLDYGLCIVTLNVMCRTVNLREFVLAHKLCKTAQLALK